MWVERFGVRFVLHFLVERARNHSASRHVEGVENRSLSHLAMSRRQQRSMATTKARLSNDNKAAVFSAGMEDPRLEEQLQLSHSAQSQDMINAGKRNSTRCSLGGHSLVNGTAATSSYLVAPFDDTQESFEQSISAGDISRRAGTVILRQTPPLLQVLDGHVDRVHLECTHQANGTIAAFVGNSRLNRNHCWHSRCKRETSIGASLK